jgi:RNA polymerase sigma factor (sigma-70 family)
MPPQRLDGTLRAVAAILRRDSCSDADLLSRFLDDRDESAFEALVLRHTPAVRAACRGWLRSPADVDDAAQATFLVLVQRARSIRDRAALGGWLYAVAANVARRLRRRQTPSCPLPENLPERGSPRDDGLRDLLAEEVGRLPEKYRLPVQLCYWSGLTTAEAAQRLGWPKGTILTRLAWARQRLQKCLTRRGLSPAVVPGLLRTAVPAVRPEWVQATVRAAKGVLAGEPLRSMKLSLRTISLTEGVVRIMVFDRLKYVALAAVVAIGLVGFGVRTWAPASQVAANGKALRDDGDSLAARDARGNEPTKADEGRPGPVGRRREALIRLPAGAFVKEVDAAPYGSGRLTWTYEEERVLGLIEGSVMGCEFELATEAEYSLSSTGTIYGLITSVRLNHLRLPDGEEFARLKPFVGLWSAVEPLVNETLLDLPFSYQFRLQGERLVITNFRILLAGPNPLGKLGGLAGGAAGSNDLAGVVVGVAYFQALGTALEGTYTAADAKDRPAPKRRPFLKPHGGFDLKKMK